MNTLKSYCGSLAIVMFLMTFDGSAQELKGSYQIGIGSQVLDINAKNYPKYPSYIPYVPFRVHGGYYHTNRLMFGVEAGFFASSSKYETYNYRISNYLIGPFAQYILTKKDKNLKFYLLSGFQYSQRQLNGKDMDSGETGEINSRSIHFRIGGGVMYRISPRFSLDANLSMGAGSFYFNTPKVSGGNADINYELQLRLIYHLSGKSKK